MAFHQSRVWDSHPRNYSTPFIKSCSVFRVTFSVQIISEEITSHHVIMSLRSPSFSFLLGWSLCYERIYPIVLILITRIYEIIFPNTSQTLSDNHNKRTHWWLKSFLNTYMIIEISFLIRIWFSQKNKNSVVL